MSSDDNVQKTIQEQTARVYDLYEKKSKYFRTAFYSISSLVVVFFGLVFYPYVSTLAEKAQIDRALAGLDENIRSISARKSESFEIVKDLVSHQREVERRIGDLIMTDLQPASQDQAIKLRELQLRLRDDPDTADWVRGLTARPAFSQGFLLRHPDLRDSNQDPCFWLVGEEWFRCELAKRVRQVHEFATGPLRRGHVSHVRNELLVPLETQLNDLETAFRDWLLGKSQRWQEGRSSSASKPRGELDVFWQLYMANFEERHRFIVEEKSNLQNRLSRLERERSRLKAAQTRAQDLLEQVKAFRNIETPIGQLPVGLDELVLIFPVLLAVGFLSCASLFAASLRLRRVFHQFTRELDPDRRIFTDDHVALVAPLWLDPLAGGWGNLVKLAILSIPALVFVSSIGLLLFHRVLLGSFPEMARLPPTAYIVLYVLCCGLIFEGYRRIDEGMRRYKQILF